MIGADNGAPGADNENYPLHLFALVLKAFVEMERLERDFRGYRVAQQAAVLMGSRNSNRFG